MSERETERPSKIFGEINNLQVIDLTHVSYKRYNIATGRCSSCVKLPKSGDPTSCTVEDSTNEECYERRKDSH